MTTIRTVVTQEFRNVGSCQMISVDSSMFETSLSMILECVTHLPAVDIYHVYTIFGIPDNLLCSTDVRRATAMALCSITIFL